LGIARATWTAERGWRGGLPGCKRGLPTPGGSKGKDASGWTARTYPGAGGMGRGPGMRVWVVEVGHPTPQDLRVMENRSCRGRGHRRRCRWQLTHLASIHTHTHTLARGGIVVAARGPAPRLVGRAVGRQMGGREDRHDEAQSARRVLGGNGAVLLAGRGRRLGARVRDTLRSARGAPWELSLSPSNS
jgi:hypothetical protein